MKRLALLLALLSVKASADAPQEAATLLPMCVITDVNSPPSSLVENV